MSHIDNKLTKIGVFYDGNYFLHVSNYYLYHHEKKSRISIIGMNRFIREEIARAEGTDSRYCQIVDAHYFKGRLKAHDAKERDILFNERVFDDVLIREGIVTHYLPLTSRGEKGVDVSFVLEAFELALYKRFNVTVLVASDGDYVPLVRKLNTLGTRVMVLGWDFKFVDDNGVEKETRTSQALLDEVTYPVLMHTVIDDRSRKNEPVVKGLFVPPPETRRPAAQPTFNPDEDVRESGTIKMLREGYGFIIPDQGGDDLFFHYLDLQNCDFTELQEGDRLTFSIGKNKKGICAVDIYLADE